MGEGRKGKGKADTRVLEDMRLEGHQMILAFPQGTKRFSVIGKEAPCIGQLVNLMSL